MRFLWILIQKAVLIHAAILAPKISMILWQCLTEVSPALQENIARQQLHNAQIKFLCTSSQDTSISQALLILQPFSKHMVIWNHKAVLPFYMCTFLMKWHFTFSWGKEKFLYFYWFTLTKKLNKENIWLIFSQELNKQPKMWSIEKLGFKVIEKAKCIKASWCFSFLQSK